MKRPSFLFALVAAAVAIAGGCREDPESDEMEPNTIAKVVAWKPRWESKPIVNAVFYRDDGKMSALREGTKILVLRRPGPARKHPENQIERTLIKVMDGPEKDAVGEVPRPHLRDTGTSLQTKKKKNLVPRNPEE